MHREESRPNSSSMKQLIALLALGFMITLGVVIGLRMSSDAIAVLVGVIAGVAASIPTALLLMAVTRRQDRYDEEYDPPQRNAPPVIVVTSGGPPQQQLPPYPVYPYQPAAVQQGRQFRVMGYEDQEEQPIDGTAFAVPWEQ
jgi:hypothetical protein